MDLVGVPQDLQKEYVVEIAKVCPIPTKKELFEEELEQPVFKIIMGEDIKKLSYFKTGCPVLNNEDQKLIKGKFGSFDYSTKTNQEKFLKLLGIGGAR